jgi:hypothetical protein
MESILTLIENNTIWINGFVTTGVILILFGLKEVTAKDLREYKLTHHNVSRFDELFAWGFFYLIFGILITAGAVVSTYIYLQ